MKRRLLLIAALTASLFSNAALAQTDKPLRILVGFPPGGSVDVVARLLADKMKDDLQRPVIVENKAGAGGRLAAEALKNSAADGNTLMLAPIAVPVLFPMVFAKLNYNPATDFAPVFHAASFTFGLAVPGNATYKTFAEFTKWMQANPEKANFGIPGAGTLPHFFGLLIGREAKVNMQAVPFQGGAPLLTSLAGGQVESGIDVLSEQLEMHRAGRVHILATSGAQRAKVAPDVPTFRELGVPGIQAQAWFAMYAPTGTPVAAISAINAAANKALAKPDVQERYAKLSLELGGGSPADLQKLQDAEIARWAPVVKASGFKAE